MTRLAIRDYLNPPEEKTASTRPQGEKVRRAILENWDTADKIIVVFEENLRATISYMDEAFAKLLDVHQWEEFRAKLKFEHLSDYNKLLLAKTIRNRLTHGIAPKPADNQKSV